MSLIGCYRNPGFEAVADGVMAFFDRRTDLQRPGIAFGPGGGDEPAKVSTDIAWWRLIEATRMLMPSPRSSCGVCPLP